MIEGAPCTLLSIYMCVRGLLALNHTVLSINVTRVVCNCLAVAHAVSPFGTQQVFWLHMTPSCLYLWTLHGDSWIGRSQSVGQVIVLWFWAICLVQPCAKAETMQETLVRMYEAHALLASAWIPFSIARGRAQ